MWRVSGWSSWPGVLGALWMVGGGAGVPESPAAPHGAMAAEAPLFESDSLLTLTVRAADLGAFIKDRDSTTKREYPATIRYARTGADSVFVPVRLVARGHFRRKSSNCPFPPVRVLFDKETAKGSLFAKQKELKLTTPCRPKDDLYEQYILREYTVYRVYNQLTPQSFRVRLVRVTYQDSLAKVAPITRYAFFVENEKAMASRLDGELMTGKATGLRQVDVEEYGLMTMFEYMIGNTDWSTQGLHNVRLVKTAQGGVIPVPYDFDFSGIVDTRYATPDARLSIKTVRERLYRGDCRTPEQLLPVFSRFAAERDAIFALYQQQPLLDKGYVKDAMSYLKEFYELAENRKRWGEFKEYCGAS